MTWRSASLPRERARKRSDKTDRHRLSADVAPHARKGGASDRAFLPCSAPLTTLLEWRGRRGRRAVTMVNNALTWPRGDQTSRQGGDRGPDHACDKQGSADRAGARRSDDAVRACRGRLAAEGTRL